MYSIISKIIKSYLAVKHGVSPDILVSLGQEFFGIKPPVNNLSPWYNNLPPQQPINQFPQESNHPLNSTPIINNYYTTETKPKKKLTSSKKKETS
jgi:hypothetical protein